VAEKMQNSESLDFYQYEIQTLQAEPDCKVFRLKPFLKKVSLNLYPSLDTIPVNRKYSTGLTGDSLLKRVMPEWGEALPQ
jgi:hypothetical protein